MKGEMGATTTAVSTVRIWPPARPASQKIIDPLTISCSIRYRLSAVIGPMAAAVSGRELPLYYDNGERKIK
jgi:hypothetical protein